MGHAQERAARARAWRRAALPLAVLLVASAVAVMTSHRVAVAREASEMQRALDAVVASVDAEVGGIADLVAGAAAHLSRTPHDAASTTDALLLDYVDALRIDDRDDGPAIAYVARVLVDDLDAAVADRRTSRPDFAVGAGSSQVFQDIVWASTDPQAPLGMRADTDPVRATALDEAQLRGQVLLTAPMPDGDGDRWVVEVVAPVTDVGDGRHLGWISATLGVEEVIGDVRAPFALTITDNRIPVNGQPVEEGAAVRSIDLPLLGRQWRVTTSTTPARVDPYALVAGLSLALLAATVTAVLQRARRRLVSDVHDVRRSRDTYAWVLEGMAANLDVGIIACDESGRITLDNPAIRRMLAPQDAAVLLGASLDHLQLVDAVGDRLTPDRLPLARALRGEDVRDEEYVLPSPDGPRTHLVNAQRISDTDGGIVGAVAVVNDITDRKAVEARMTRLAMVDHLTGLANRRSLTLSLRAALAEQGAGGARATVLFMDLDRFKQVNDTLGHHRGDRMLVEIADRLTEIAHPGDVAARMGGDEFVLLCPHQQDAAGAQRLAEAVVRALGQALIVDQDAGVRSGVSVGVVRPGTGSSVEDVLRHADLAMYDAKRDPDRPVSAYDPAMGHRATAWAATETALRRALSARQLAVAYQPIVDIAAGRTIGVEALVRWERDGQLLLPGAFLPVAEATGLITELDLLVLDLACGEVAALVHGPKVGVNLSARTLAMPDLVERVRAVLDVHGLDPGRLVLELTESALIGGSRTIDHSMADLTDMGVLLSLDDFGVGYASLSYLRRFPVQSIKIDRTFVQDLHRSDEDRAIVGGTIEMAARLGLRTVAEGVETPRQAAVLSELGCDMLQGHLLGRPGTLASALQVTSPPVWTPPPSDPAYAQDSSERSRRLPQISWAAEDRFRV